MSDGACYYRIRLRNTVSSSKSPIVRTGEMIGRTIQRPVCLYAFLCLSSGAVFAEVYKWTDEAGRVHFGDKPPDSNAAEAVEIRKTPASADDARMEKRRQKRGRLLEIFDEDRRRTKENDEAALNKEKQRGKKCSESRKQLEKIVNAGFLYEKTGDPRNPKVLTETERKAATERLRGQVEKWCR